MLGGCSKSPNDELDLAKVSGQYKFMGGDPQSFRRKDFAEERLTLSPNGSFRQECRYAKGQVAIVEGSWSIQGGAVVFSTFSDCAGIWPLLDGRLGSASLILEKTRPMTILISPDLNVRYERGGGME
jgi:hypothetical protein